MNTGDSQGEKMTSQKVCHTQKEYGLKEGAQDFPLMVVLSFVYVCNARCPNCPYNNSTIRDTYADAMIMPESVFQKIADECGPRNAYIRISGGGEPMLHPQAVELICYAKEKGAKVGLISNGSRFDKQNLTTLIESGVENIEFSVDAPDCETYAKVRPGLDWHKLNENVAMALSIRDELKADTRIIVSVINQKGVDVVAAEQYWQSRSDNVQVRKYLTWGYNKEMSADDMPYLPPEQYIPCPWLFERMNIDSRGDVTLCGEDIAFSEQFANIMEESIAQIWRGKEFEALREKHLAGKGFEIPICSQCPDWQYRSWNYNYWKVVEDADQKRKKRL